MKVTEASSSPDRYFIQGYGAHHFWISGEDYTGSILISPKQVMSWTISSVGDLTVESLAPLLDADDGPEILLLGCGERIVFPAKSIRQALRERRIGLELMDTGAACRTYNVLMMEDRRVAAALIALE